MDEARLLAAEAMFSEQARINQIPLRAWLFGEVLTRAVHNQQRSAGSRHAMCPLRYLMHRVHASLCKRTVKNSIHQLTASRLLIAYITPPRHKKRCVASFKSWRKPVNYRYYGTTTYESLSANVTNKKRQNTKKKRPLSCLSQAPTKTGHLKTSTAPECSSWIGLELCCLSL